MKAKVDHDLCVGAAYCEAVCPKVFKVVNGKSQVQLDPLPQSEVDCSREAADGCPVGAISVS